jgi:hypothetical protein
MTTVSLAELFQARDEGIASMRTRAKHRPFARAYARLRAVPLAPARRALAVAVLWLATFASRHALVLAGCSAFVTAAAMMTPIAGWITTGLALFFLEARRR